MRLSRNGKAIIVIVLASLALACYVVPQIPNAITAAVLPSSVESKVTLPPAAFVLGLDLLGGAHLQYQADLSGVPGDQRADAMQGVRDVVERRVNFFGVSEPVVQVLGEDRLIVELAGVADVSQAIRLIGETPLLEFREQGTEVGADGVPIIDATIDANGNLVPDTTYQGWKATGLTGKQVSRAQITFDPQTNRPQVSLELTEEGAKLFAEITKRNLGQPVAIFLDRQIISVPTVQAEITDGNAVISGNFTPAEARQLAQRLNSGALPVPIGLVSQQAVGASLGAVSLANSLRAAAWGLALVALFMIVFYRLPGVMAVLALGVYVLLVLAVYQVLPVTLTLAGIAGFTLSLGIAVDANVLIFARMREELAAGRSLKHAMELGFSRAWLSIRDSHVTTIISAVVLYLFTVSIVRGFALTLGIGVLSSLLTATVVTRAFLVPFSGPRSEKHRWLFK